MREIWKFTLQINVITEIALPGDTKILYFRIQKETPYIWAIVNVGIMRDARIRKDIRRFIIRGTGHPDDNMLGYNYIGSDFSDGSYVWHCFEIK